MKNNITIPEPKIQTLRQRSDPIFGRLLMAIRNVTESDFSVYQPDHAIKLKSEILQKPRKELHALIKEFLTDSEARKNNINQKINSYSKSKVDPDPSKQIVSSLRQQEIRGLLRNMELTERKSMVESELENGNSEILTAISSSPDPLMPTKTLTKYRNQLAFSKDPDLENYKHQVDSLETIVRKECGKLNADHTAILLENKLEDPISLSQHFETFPPKDADDARRADNMIKSRNYDIALIKQRQTFAAQNKGINLS